MRAHTHTYSPLFHPSSPLNPPFHLGQFFILVEFASGGNLLSYLKQMRKDRQTMSWSKGLGFALQIANGMAHLADKEVCVRTYVCTYVRTYVQLLLYIGVHMYVCMYVHMCTFLSALVARIHPDSILPFAIILC